MSDQEQATTEEKTKKAGRPAKKVEPTNSEKLVGIVREILSKIVHKKVRINHEEQTSGVDLGSRGLPTGLQFRQLLVKAQAGFIKLSLIEGFKPAHGGSEQRKTLYSLVVPVSQTEAYSALQTRFFAYDLAKNVEQGEVFLDTVLETLSKSDF